MTKGAKRLLIIVGAFMAYDYATRSPLDGMSQGLLTDLISGVTGLGMNISQNGIAAIQQREGTSSSVYQDNALALNLTAGTGHLLTPLDKLSYSLGDTVPAAQIASWFNSDIAHAAALVNRYVTQPLTQNQFDALVSMAFNLGGQLFRNSDGSSTMILSALNSGDMAGAANHIMDWVIPASITDRRIGEQTQFES
jgi:GH24 family phage-related lysozyme (muramidase)